MAFPLYGAGVRDGQRQSLSRLRPDQSASDAEEVAMMRRSVEGGTGICFLCGFGQFRGAAFSSALLLSILG